MRGNRGIRALITAAVVLGLVLIAAVAVVFAGICMNRAPLLEPPGFVARMGLYLGSNVAETSPTAALPELLPLRVSGDAQSALRAVSRAAIELGWHDVSLDEDTGLVRATVVTSLFRFRDDVRASVSAQRTDHTEVHVRSASRVGRGDLGANANHIMQLRDALRRQGVLQAEAL